MPSCAVSPVLLVASDAGSHVHMLVLCNHLPSHGLYDALILHLLGGILAERNKCGLLVVLLRCCESTLCARESYTALLRPHSLLQSQRAARAAFAIFRILCCRLLGITLPIR